MTDEINRPLEDEEKAKLVAETKAAEALARNHNANALQSELQAEAGQLELERAQYQHRSWEALSTHHRAYAFTTDISDKSVAVCMDAMTTWMRLDAEDDKTDRPYEITFSSPGGSVVAGLAFWDFLQSVRQQGHPLTTVALGYAASMAGILLQAGDTRVIGRESWLLIHQISAGMMGTWGELIDRTAWLERIQNRIVDIFYDRAQLADAEVATKKLSKKAIKVKWERKDWWLDSTESLEHGFVDEVR